MVHVILENSAIRTFQFLFKQKTVSVIVSGKDLLFSLNTLLEKTSNVKTSFARNNQIKLFKISNQTPVKNATFYSKKPQFKKIP